MDCTYFYVLTHSATLLSPQIEDRLAQLQHFKRSTLLRTTKFYVEKKKKKFIARSDNSI
jgi:hypothetical protein